MRPKLYKPEDHRPIPPAPVVKPCDCGQPPSVGPRPPGVWWTGPWWTEEGRRYCRACVPDAVRYRNGAPQRAWDEL
jgi:hypothetical protein